MTLTPKLWWLLLLPVMLLPAACGGQTAAPALGRPGQPTLVFIYTGG